MYKFKPLLKQTLWGGTRIIPFKKLDMEMENVGESWEISGVKGNESIIDGGQFDGMSLNELLSRQQATLVGEENYARFGCEFPLLVKFIDARQNLSIQVHPNDETARRQGHEHGKTEMWYALESDAGAMLYNGLKQNITPMEYKQMVADGTIVNALAQYEVNEGDVFFIPAGRIHAIGAGCFVAEIQQTSDVTYRIYDYKRRDKDGNYRQLHTDQAAESIDYSVLPDYRTHYVPAVNKGQELVSCPFFTTAVYDLTEPMTLDYSELDSFVILIGVKGEGMITDDTGEQTTLKAGETILLPATTKTVKVEGTVRLLETFV